MTTPVRTGIAEKTARSPKAKAPATGARVRNDSGASRKITGFSSQRVRQSLNKQEGEPASSLPRRPNLHLRGVVTCGQYITLVKMQYPR